MYPPPHYLHFQTAIFTPCLRRRQQHARVNQALLRLRHDSDSLFIQIEDHGCGFSLSEASSRWSSLGLLDMRSRASMLGGRLQIETQVHSGCRITVELPIRSAAGPTQP